MGISKILDIETKRVSSYRTRVTSILFISNPLVPFLYFFNIITLLFLFNSILFTIVAFFTIILESVYLLGKEKTFQNYKYYFLIFVVLIIMNLIFVHRGQTVLFYFLGKRITLEAIIYGLYNGMFLVSMLMMFNILNEVIGTKGIIQIFSNILPQSSFLISFTIRWTNVLNLKAKEYFDVQTLKKRKTERKKLINSIENLEFFVKNSLEEGFVIGEMLRVKSYGKFRRSNYKKLDFFIEDIVFVIAQIILTVILIYFFKIGIGSIDYYNNEKNLLNSREFFGMSVYFIFLLLPIIIDFILKFRRKRSLWKY